MKDSQNCLILEGRRKEVFPFFPLCPYLCQRNMRFLKPKIGEPSMARKGSRKAFLSSYCRLSRFPSLSFITHLCLHLALWVCSHPSFSIHPSPISIFLFPSSCPPFASSQSYISFSALPFSPALHIALSSLLYQVHTARNPLGLESIMTQQRLAPSWPWRKKLAFSECSGFLHAPFTAGGGRANVGNQCYALASGIREAHRVDLFGASQRESF